ncbi:MAG: hypothetical protein ACLQKH_09415 [Steroidobacteraceae bacterium]
MSFTIYILREPDGQFWVSCAGREWRTRDLGQGIDCATDWGIAEMRRHGEVPDREDPPTLATDPDDVEMLALIAEFEDRGKPQ